MQVFETFLEFLLLGRMLLLKMQRTYVYLTLYAAITVLLDTASLVVGIESDPGVRIFFYSKFLFALLYPLTAWDVFEEARTRVSKLRRLHLPRLITGVFLSVILGIVVSLGVEDQDYKGTSSTTDFIGLFLWLGAASTSLLFTWNVFRSGRSSDVVWPNNTFVWAIFFLLTFARAVIDCAVDVADGLIPHTAFQVLAVVFTLFDACLIVWCAARLKPLPGNSTSEPEKASL